VKPAEFSVAKTLELEPASVVAPPRDPPGLWWADAPTPGWEWGGGRVGRVGRPTCAPVTRRPCWPLQALKMGRVTCCASRPFRVTVLPL
jgi:hypothetical protein